ncbi:hypothetical protein [Nocardiopsis sp. Huas11]|uniref:hypothetical protein n=1 Tax=Nocardiopsis sp. Huas11 TaxID=2183912 RepID=UPI000EB388C7|nr:hypothetical protein [Nocardiopsis sp. Huas11]
MSWEGIDHALNRVRGEADRISLNLTDLDQNVGHRLLNGAKLTGRTLTRWEHARRHVHSLWTVHGAFMAVVERATELRARGRDGQRELTFLLTGESVTLPKDVPLAERGLLDEDAEHISPAEAIARMSADYEEVTEVVSVAETAWDALHPRLSELDAMWQEIGTLSDMVELGDTEHEALRAELAQVGEVVRRDPLSLFEDGRVDTSSLERMRGRLERTRGELRDALRMRDSFDESVERLNSAVDDVETVLRRARALRGQVVRKISAPEAVEVPDPVPGLRARLKGMDVLRAQSRWRDLGALLGELQRAVHTAADDAREREANLTGLLERRAELRGRLDAYRARAVRLGLAEEDRLVDLHREAHWGLWSAPCDLRRATVALSAYQRTLVELSGTESAQNRTTPGAAASDGESDGGVR